MSFEAWMNKVDRYFSNNFGGLTSEDFPDWDWREAYDDELTPYEAFKQYKEEHEEDLE